jgi:polar amino acid transport system substrate-binding protein
MIVKSTVNFSVEYGRDVPLIKGNPQQLEQVFINLIQNACQALENNQQAIHVFTCYDPSITRVIIGVKDQGPGIPTETLKFIMDPFFTTRRKNGGTGLGLSVSSGIIQGHHGELNVESTVGKGSTFMVLLPADGIEGKQLTKDRRQRTADRRRKTEDR